ncbi:sacsin-like [Watersipora subatra]
MNCEIMIQLEMRYQQSIEVCHFLGLFDRVLDRSVHWLVISSMGDWDALEIALRYEGLAPVGGMAVPLDQKYMRQDVLQPRVMKETESDGYAGKVFCYLPLPMKSRLPVHININIASKSCIDKAYCSFCVDD